MQTGLRLKFITKLWSWISLWCLSVFLLLVSQALFFAPPISTKLTSCHGHNNENLQVSLTKHVALKIWTSAKMNQSFGGEGYPLTNAYYTQNPWVFKRFLPAFMMALGKWAASNMWVWCFFPVSIRWKFEGGHVLGWEKAPPTPSNK